MSLTITNLHYTLGKKTLLDSINLEAFEGEIVAIIGPNGAGKSTLLKHIAALFPLHPSCIKLDNLDFSALTTRTLAQHVAYLGQFLDFPPLSVLETLEIGRRAYGGIRLTRHDYKKIDASVCEFGLENLLEHSLECLSGGERQKVLIASALLQEPKILLLDEPISHLDPKNQLEMLRAITSITTQKGLITFIVLHDIQHAIHFATRLVLLKNGSILYDIPTESIDATMLESLFDVPAALHENQGHTFVYYGHRHDDNTPDHQHPQPHKKEYL